MSNVNLTTQNIEENFLNFQEFTRLKSQLKPGESLVVENTGNGFNVIIGKIRVKSGHKVGKITPSKLHNSFDVETAGGKHEHMRTTSFATPMVVAGFKSSWEDMVKIPSNSADFVVVAFLDKLKKILAEDLKHINDKESYVSKLSYHIIETSYTKIIELTIKNHPSEKHEITMGFSHYGTARYYIYNGIKTEI